MPMPSYRQRILFASVIAIVLMASVCFSVLKGFSETRAHEQVVAATAAFDGALSDAYLANQTVRTFVVLSGLGVCLLILVFLTLANLQFQGILRDQGVRDPMTRLFNRRYLDETLMREIARAKRNGQSIATLMMDIDHFKRVNDTHGHDGGDAVLCHFAKILEGKIRKEDIACRMGGEEFILILPTANAELAMARAQEICDATRDLKIDFEGRLIKVTVSIGVCVFPDHAATGEELLARADFALYRAKNEGRDRAILFNPALQKEPTES